MPRAKKAEPAEVINLPVAEDKIAHPAALVEDDATLVSQYIATRDWIAEESKRFAAHLQPYKARMEAIENEFLKRLNERGQDASPTEHGTAYKSVLLNVSLSPEGPAYGPLMGREAFLDFCLDNWEGFGNEALIFSAQKDAVKKYKEEHEGSPPPGVATSYFIKVNIRKS